MALLEHMRDVQNDLLSSLTYRSYEMQIEALFKRCIASTCLDMRNRSTPDSEEKANHLIKNFLSLLIKTECTDLTDLITKDESQGLEIKIQNLLACMPDGIVSEEKRGHLLASLNLLMQKVQENPYLQMAKSTTQISQQVHVEQQVEVKVEKEKQTHQELQREVNQVVSTEDLFHREEVELNFGHIIKHFRKISHFYFDSESNLLIAPISLRNTAAKKTFYNQAFRTLYLSSNTLDTEISHENTLVDPYKKKLASLLVILNGKGSFKPTIIGLSQEETLSALNYFSAQENKEVLLLSERALSLLDDQPRDILSKYRETIQKALVEMMVYNLHIEELQTISSAAQRWLTDPLAPEGVRKNLIVAICQSTEKLELLSAINHLGTKEMEDELLEFREKTIEQIHLAELMLQQGREDAARAVLRKYPIDQLESIPDQLCSFLPKHYQPLLSLPSQLQALSDRDVCHLHKDQLSLLPDYHIKMAMQQNSVSKRALSDNEMVDYLEASDEQ